jgi:hypothetical protein
MLAAWKAMPNARLRKASHRRLVPPIGPAAFDSVDEASEESMVCSDAPEAGGLHVGGPVEPYERKWARRPGARATKIGTAPWIALAVGCALAGFFVLGMGMGMHHRRWG